MADQVFFRQAIWEAKQKTLSNPQIQTSFFMIWLKLNKSFQHQKYPLTIDVLKQSSTLSDTPRHSIWPV